MTTHTHAALARANRGTRYHGPDAAPLTRGQLDELATELRREIVRIERSLAFNVSSPELDAFRSALLRIGEGTYGLCIACDRAISFARLQVMPATQWCVRCAR